MLRNFIVVQPAPLWSDITIELSARSGALNALSSSILRESDAFEFSVSRLPWGDSIRLSGTGIDQNEKFTLATLPTTSLVYAPLSLTVLTLVGLIGAFVAGLALTKERRRTSLYVELVLVPVVLLITVLGYPPLFIGIALGLSLIHI